MEKFYVFFYSSNYPGKLKSQFSKFPHVFRHSWIRFSFCSRLWFHAAGWPDWLDGSPLQVWMPFTLLGPAEPLIWGTPAEQHRGTPSEENILSPFFRAVLFLAPSIFTSFGLRSCDVDDERLQLGTGLVQVLDSGSLGFPVIQQVLKAERLFLIIHPNIGDTLKLLKHPGFLLHTCSCWTRLCRPSVLRLASLEGSWSWAVCSQRTREPERLRNWWSCCSQAWTAANLAANRRQNRIH